MLQKLSNDIGTQIQSFESGFEHTAARLELVETAVYTKQPAKETMVHHVHSAIGWTYSPP